MRWAPEDGLRQSGEVDLLLQVIRMLAQQLVIVDVVRQCIVGGKVAAVEGEDEVTEPRTLFAIGEGIENGM